MDPILAGTFSLPIEKAKSENLTNLLGPNHEKWLKIESKEDELIKVLDNFEYRSRSVSLTKKEPSAAALELKGKLSTNQYVEK